MMGSCGQRSPNSSEPCPHTRLMRTELTQLQKMVLIKILRGPSWIENPNKESLHNECFSSDPTVLSMVPVQVACMFGNLTIANGSNNLPEPVKPLATFQKNRENARIPIRSVYVQILKIR